MPAFFTSIPHHHFFCTDLKNHGFSALSYCYLVSYRTSPRFSFRCAKNVVGCLGAHWGSHLGAHLGSLFHATRERNGMKKTYQMKEDGRNRIRFRIRTPKQLRDWLPKFIMKNETSSFTPQVESRSFPSVASTLIDL